MNSKSAKNRLIEKGIRAGEVDMYDEDTIWSQNSSDKVDIAEELMRIVREIFRSVPLDRNLKALSIGSGSEPQFQILEASFREGLFLLDIDRIPLSVIDRRIKSHWIDHVSTIQADYNKTLVCIEDAQRFLREELGGSRQDLITLHHSLYYASESDWAELFSSLYSTILSFKGFIHAVMMSSDCREKNSTTWLYNHFAGKFFGCRNDQDLVLFSKTLGRSSSFRKADIHVETHRVKFFNDDFEKFMAVIWMILLYPNVHDYTLDQKEEITEYVYGNFYKTGKPLIQMQDHLVIGK
ncbi:MAG: class I SAM-dependent methyltransferase [Candidatus Aegiribacteria sp.]|nr:class I SAM-dependent methyltransferase [Candidatus Aegiribacteria sp.]